MEIEDKYLIEIIYWARRYCDGRSTFSPSYFNQIYESLLEKHGENYPKAYKGKVLKGDIEDKTLTNEGEFWPFAQDGMFDPTKNRFDATKKHKY